MTITLITIYDEKNVKTRSRLLKATATGDFWRKKIVPMIRITGKWVVAAGIQPDDHVSVENPEPGVLPAPVAQAQVVIRRVNEVCHVHE